ncbi:MAG: hypothetical protein DLM59_14580 [Pseudonocardiales bacterium]|nr:MAG: hypothetical protein DLM59_14580 [Pseudonocardiales bacterium]
MPDPSGIRPLCDEQEFTAILDAAVADEAPRLFAVVQVYGDRVDARIAAWGLAFEGHAEVVSSPPAVRMSLRAPKNCLRGFTIGSHVRARLVWVKPGAPTPVQDDDHAGVVGAGSPP